MSIGIFLLKSWHVFLVLHCYNRKWQTGMEVRKTNRTKLHLAHFSDVVVNTIGFKIANKALKCMNCI